MIWLCYVYGYACITKCILIRNGAKLIYFLDKIEKRLKEKILVQQHIIQLVKHLTTKLPASSCEPQRHPPASLCERRPPNRLELFSRVILLFTVYTHVHWYNIHQYPQHSWKHTHHMYTVKLKGVQHSNLPSVNTSQEAVSNVLFNGRHIQIWITLLKCLWSIPVLPLAFY